MAVKKSTKQERMNFAAPDGAQNEFQRFITHIQENPMLYAACAGFVLLCAVAGGLFGLKNQIADQDVMTAYAIAIDTTDPALQASALELIAQGRSRWAVETLYLMGEASIQAGEYAKAKIAFTKMREEHPGSIYAGPAAEGLAFLAENEGDFETALAGYQEVYAKWKGTFVSRRQPINIGRVQESLQNFEGAINSYNEQIQVFAGSRLALRSAAELARLKEEHPDLFPEEPVPAGSEGPTADTPETPDEDGADDSS